jgi:hypothetical protein
MEKYDIQSSRRGRLTELAKSCEGNCLLQHIIEGKKKGNRGVKTRTKTQAATAYPQQKDRVLETDRQH